LARANWEKCFRPCLDRRGVKSAEVLRGWCDKSSPFEYIGVHYVDAYYFITGLKPPRSCFGKRNCPNMARMLLMRCRPS
jgi:hypothetical protein